MNKIWDELDFELPPELEKMIDKLMPNLNKHTIILTTTPNGNRGFYYEWSKRHE